MIEIHNKDKNKKTQLTIAIGNFDGVHLGHQQLIKIIKQFHDSESAVLTFNPHPLNVLLNEKFYLLTTIEQKINILQEMDVNHLYIKEFNKEFANYTIQEFIDFLHSLNVIRVVIGKDFRFGSKGSGSYIDLEKEFEVIVVEDQIDAHNIRISSSYIKDLLLSGKIKEVNTLLTRNYFVEGNVKHGNKVGRTLGFPTANVDVIQQMLPKNGIYECLIEFNDKKYHGLANVGNNPTINYTKDRRLEVYIFDFEENIYNQNIKVHFLDYLRNEIKFSSKDELISQIKKDEELVRNRHF